MSVQLGNNLVTNPLPSTISQNSLATFADPDADPKLTVTRFAKIENGTVLTTSILSDEIMLQIVNICVDIEVRYCKAKPGYYENAPCRFVYLDPQKSRSLDIEFKLLSNGHFVVKQAREFHGQ